MDWWIELCVNWFWKNDTLLRILRSILSATVSDSLRQWRTFSTKECAVIMWKSSQFQLLAHFRVYEMSMFLFCFLIIKPGWCAYSCKRWRFESLKLGSFSLLSRRESTVQRVSSSSDEYQSLLMPDGVCSLLYLFCTTLVSSSPAICYCSSSMSMWYFHSWHPMGFFFNIDFPCFHYFQWLRVLHQKLLLVNFAYCFWFLSKRNFISATYFQVIVWGCEQVGLHRTKKKKKFNKKLTFSFYRRTLTITAVVHIIASLIHVSTIYLLPANI